MRRKELWEWNINLNCDLDHLGKRKELISTWERELRRKKHFSKYSYIFNTFTCLSPDFLKFYVSAIPGLITEVINYSKQLGFFPEVLDNFRFTFISLFSNLIFVISHCFLELSLALQTKELLLRKLFLCVSVVFWQCGILREDLFYYFTG